jgi:hypothetical protein
MNKFDIFDFFYNSISYEVCYREFPVSGWRKLFTNSSTFKKYYIKKTTKYEHCPHEIKYLGKTGDIFFFPEYHWHEYFYQPLSEHICFWNNPNEPQKLIDDAYKEYQIRLEEWNAIDFDYNTVYKL